MKEYPTITTLKDFVSLYSIHKSDIEIARLLNISIEDVKSVKTKTQQKNKIFNLNKLDSM